MEEVGILKNRFVLGRAQVLAFAKFCALLALAVIMPLAKQQLITGSGVNATLFLAAAMLGPEGALLIGLVPSLVSISIGLLPAVLAPMIPFIMVGNTILIIAFNNLRRRNYWGAVLISSLLKFLFLYSTSSLVINLLLKKEIAAQVALMMSWPQLLTALIGGAIAWFILKKGSYAKR